MQGLQFNWGGQPQWGSQFNWGGQIPLCGEATQEAAAKEGFLEATTLSPNLLKDD